MNRYYTLLYHVFTHQPSTRFHLEHLEKGKFSEQIDQCITLGYIQINGKNTNGDDLYYITDKGMIIVDNPKEGV